MTIDVTTTQSPVAVSVNDTTVSVSVVDNVTTATISGGTGPAGAKGDTGATGAAGTTSWTGLTDKPATFSPTAHATSHGALGGDPITVAVSQVTGLQAALDGKQPSGSYAPLTHTHTASAITDFSAAVAAAAPPTTDASLLTSGTLAAARLPASVVLTGDSRLSDARTPSSTLAHSSTHAAAGSDPVTLTISQTTGLQAALDLKSPLASPTFTGTVSGVTKAAVGLGNADNTADSSKPVSTAQAAADAAVQAYAIQRANHTGTQSAGTITGLGAVATSNNYSDLTGKPTIPSAYSLPVATGTVLGGVKQGSNTTIAADGTISVAAPVTTLAYSAITGTPTLAAVATSGSYVDLTNKPTIPSAYTLPVSTSAVLGGVKQGSNTTISGDGTISVAAPVTSLPYSSITGTPSLSTVATSGSYTDLTSKPTLGTSSALDVAATGNATSGQVVKGSDTRLSDSRTPSSTLSHASTHGSSGTDPISIAYTQVTGLGTLATQSGTFSGTHSGTSSGSNTGDQTVTLTGDVTGTGTGSFATTLAASGATAGTYTSVTVDTKGRVTGGTNPAGYTLPNATASILGGITVSTGLSVTSGAVSVAYGTTSTTSCVGNDSRLSDSRTPTSHVHGNITNAGAIGSTSGQIVVTTASGVLTTAASIASSAVTGLATVATSGLASDLTGTLADARLSANIPTISYLDIWLGGKSGVVEVFPSMLSSGNTAYVSGNVWFTFFTPLITTTITTITMYSSATAASGLTLSRFGLYTFDETTATLVARTDSNTGNFGTANTAYARVLSATGGYPTSYTLTAGTRYAVALICIGTTMPTIATRVQSTAFSATVLPQRMGQVTAQTDLPTSATIQNLNSCPFARLS